MLGRLEAIARGERVNYLVIGGLWNLRNQILVVYTLRELAKAKPEDACPDGDAKNDLEFLHNSNSLIVCIYIGGRLGSRTLVPICLVLFRRNHGEPNKKAFKHRFVVYERRPDGLGYMQDCNADRKKGAW